MTAHERHDLIITTKEAVETCESNGTTFKWQRIANPKLRKFPVKISDSLRTIRDLRITVSRKPQTALPTNWN